MNLLYLNELVYLNRVSQKLNFKNKNNKKSFLVPVQNLSMYFVKKHNIALMTLIMNRLAFYSRK